MRKFREFISEEIMPFAQTEKGFVGIDNGPVRDNINLLLANVTTMPYSTPYHAMESIRRVLISFHIALPATNFLSGESGHEVFPINQFGKKLGALPSGEVVTQMPSSYYVYFEYEMTDSGSFDIFCEVIDEEELSTIMSDIEDEESDAMEHDAEDSYDAYKAANMSEQIVYRGENKDSAKRRKIMSVLHTRKTNKLLPGMHEDYDSKEARMANRAKEFFNDPSKITQSNARKIYKKHNDQAVTGMKKEEKDGDWSKDMKRQRKYAEKKLTPKAKAARDLAAEKLDEDSATAASKKAEKGTKWKVKSRNWDREGSEVELRQGKRVKMKGTYDRNASMFTMSKTKKGKFDPKSKQKDYDDAKDILKTVKEETVDEQAKWRQGKEANPASVNPRNDVLKPVPGKKMRSGIRTWLSDGKRKTPVQGHANTPDQKGSMAGPRRGAVLPEETLDERNMENKKAKDAFVTRTGNTARKAGDPMHLTNKGTGMRTSVANKIRGRELTQGRNRVEEEMLDEVSKQLASKASEKAYEKGSEHYDTTTKLRRKAFKSKDKADMDAANAEQGKMSKKWKQSMKFKAYADKKMEEETKKDKPPFDNPTEKPSTPYKNPAAKSKQLARAAMKAAIKKAKSEKK